VKTIYKYRIPRREEFDLVLPKHARVVRVAPQRGEAFMWALVDTEQPDVRVTFKVVGTGQEVGEAYYMHSWEDGDFIWHLFYVSEDQSVGENKA